MSFCTTTPTFSNSIRVVISALLLGLLCMNKREEDELLRVLQEDLWIVLKPVSSEVRYRGRLDVNRRCLLIKNESQCALTDMLSLGSDCNCDCDRAHAPFPKRGSSRRRGKAFALPGPLDDCQGLEDRWKATRDSGKTRAAHKFRSPRRTFDPT
jgi:hypothetical protein